MIAPRVLLHVTLETGGARRSLLHELDPAVLDLVRPVLEAAIGDGQLHELGAGWRVSATEGHEPDGTPRLDATLYAPDVQGHVTVRMEVVEPSRGAPVLTASTAGLVAAPNPIRAALEAGDIARRLAWVWLTRAGE